MRSSSASIPALLVAFHSLVRPTLANPFPKDSLHDFLNLGFLKDRSCATYCGAENEHCCAADQLCTTSGNVAGCATPITLVVRADGDYTVYTTTWTETATFTSTISSYWAAPTAVGGGTCTPEAGSGEIACGSICCASWQYCAYDGQCLSNPGATATSTAASAGTTSYSTYDTTITTSGTTITTQFSAPYRVTGTGDATTATGTLESATGTANVNGTLASTGGSHLSGGAIAGIVVGVIAGVALLLAICACCIMRGLWYAFLALFGLGGKKKKSRSRERETIIVEEERYSRHGRAASVSQRDRHSGWYAADRPPRSTAAESRRPSEKKRDSNATSWAGAGALSTILVMLGLRRDKKRRESAAAKRTSRPRSSRPRSAVSSSYFSDSYTATDPSEFSSDYTYSSVYTPVQSQHHRGPRTESIRSASVGAGRYRDDPYPPKSNHPPEYADSASDGDRTRDSRRTRRTSTTRISRAPSRR